MEDKRDKLRSKIDKLKKNRQKKKEEECRSALDYSTPEALASARTHYNPDSRSSIKNETQKTRTSDYRISKPH